MVRSARISTGPSGVLAFTPVTVSPDRIRSVASTSIITLSDGNRLPLSRRKLRKSHCGMKAMNGYFVFSRRRSAMRIERSPNLPSIVLQPLMRKFQKSVDQAEFVHHLQRRGMHGVAAKIPEEIGVLFQHHVIDAGAAEQIAQHHAGRTAADDAAARGDGARRRSFPRSAGVHDLAPVRSTATLCETGACCPCFETLASLPPQHEVVVFRQANLILSLCEIVRRGWPGQARPRTGGVGSCSGTY